MTLADCAPGDKVRLQLAAFHPATVAHLELDAATYVVQVAEPLAGGVGVNILDDFTLEASEFAPRADEARYGFTVVMGDARVLEVVERTKYPRSAARDKGEGRSEDVIDPLRRKSDGLV